METCGTKKKADNAVQVAKGKVGDTAAKKIGNGTLRARGRTDQMMENLKLAGEKAKDAFKK